MAWEYQDGQLVYVEDQPQYNFDYNIPTGNEFLFTDPYTGENQPYYYNPADYATTEDPTTSYDWSSILNNPTFTGLLGTGINALGSYVTATNSEEAARQLANVQASSAMQAAEAAKFKPVGVTTRFGGSQYGYDAQGNLTSAGYQTAPDVKAMQDSLMDTSGGLLRQFQGALGATQPMAQGAQSAMGLGQQYLGTSPQAQAAKYMEEQQALLAPYREREMAQLQNTLHQQGRSGLAMGATSTGMGAANPEMEALMNARRMQDLQLAAQATQGGMDYAKYGAGMVGTGGGLLGSMYGTQTQAFNPYGKGMEGSAYLESLGQQPMDMGINIGAKGTAASQISAPILQRGLTSAAQTMQPSQAYSPWGNLLQGAGGLLQQSAWGT